MGIVNTLNVSKKRQAGAHALAKWRFFIKSLKSMGRIDFGGGLKRRSIRYKIMGSCFPHIIEPKNGQLSRDYPGSRPKNPWPLKKWDFVTKANGHTPTHLNGFVFLFDIRVHFS